MRFLSGADPHEQLRPIRAELKAKARIAWTTPGRPSGRPLSYPPTAGN